MEGDFGVRQRADAVLKNTVLLLVIGVAYVALIKCTGIGIPCVFNAVTGLYCPGCGISRMFLSLLRLDFHGAASANILALCLLPAACFIIVYKIIKYIKNGSLNDPLWLNVIYTVIGVLIFAFGVLRNLPQFSLFVPH